MRYILIFFLLVSNYSFAQKYISESSQTTFFSSALLEDIQATNDEARSVFDAENGEIVFSVPINQFQFKKALMQEHFNEKYLESDKFPKSTFSGKIINFTKGDLNKDVTAVGTLEIHGKQNKIEASGSLDFKEGKVYLESKFLVRLEDYDIEIPSLLFQNIAEEVEVTVSFEYKLYEN